MSVTWKILLPAAALMARIVGAATLNVPAGGDLQGALNAAHPGDTIQLAAGAQFVGHYYLPPNPGTQTITIQSSAISSLPAGVRVSPGQSALMPKLRTPDSSPALQMTTGAAYYRIQGVEFLGPQGVYIQDMVQVGTGNENAPGLLPHDIDLDRDYIHGDVTAGSKRGVALNGVNITVENSYISEFKSTWQDTQAIAGWNGPGPFRILNNHLEGGAETVAFGGVVPAIQGVIPSDILIQNNGFIKPLSWQPGSSTYAGMPVWAKNHIELKFAQRVTIDSNTFDNNWVGADQRGFTMVFNVRCENGAVPWAVVNGVTVTNNVIRHSAAGAVFVGHDGNSGGEGSAGQFLLQNNVWEDIGPNWGGDGRLFQIQYGVNGITIDHNTAFEAGFLLVFDSGPSYNINYTNNISNIGWGVAGDGAGSGNSALQAYALGGVFRRNIIIGGSSAGYPSDNFFPSNIDAVGFVNYPGENFLLSVGSPFRGLGTDGSNLGSATVPGALTSPAPVATAPALIPTGWVEVVNNNSGSCVDMTAVNGSELLVNTQIQQYTCLGGKNQEFQFLPVAGGYMITNRASGLQLDVIYMSTNDGAAIIQYPYWGGSNEVWSLVDAGNGYYTIHPNNSGKCMDVYGGSTANAVQIEQWTCTGGTNQQFKLVPVQ